MSGILILPDSWRLCAAPINWDLVGSAFFMFPSLVNIVVAIYFINEVVSYIASVLP